MNRAEFFTALCKRLGLDATPWRLAVFDFWAQQEGMPFAQTFNPLATTMTGDLDTTFNQGYGPGNWNSVPVRVYRTAEAGVTATYETLINGYYENILRCLADQKGYEAAVKPHDFFSWVGSESYGQRVVDFMNTTDAAKGSDVTDPRIDRLERIVAGNGFDADGQRITGEAALAYADKQGYSLVLGIQKTNSRIADLAASIQTLPGVSPDVLTALIALGDAAKKAQGAKA